MNNIDFQAAIFSEHVLSTINELRLDIILHDDVRLFKRFVGELLVLRNKYYKQV